MLKKIDGKWAIVSKKSNKPLAYYKGDGKPDEEWVKEQEKRIQYFKNKKELLLLLLVKWQKKWVWDVRVFYLQKKN